MVKVPNIETMMENTRNTFGLSSRVAILEKKEAILFIGFELSMENRLGR